MCIYRSVKDFDRAAVKGAVNVPAVVKGGSSLNATYTVNPQFQSLFAKHLGKAADVVVLGPTAGLPGAEEAFGALRDAIGAVWKARRGATQRGLRCCCYAVFGDAWLARRGRWSFLCLCPLTKPSFRRPACTSRVVHSLIFP